MSTKDKTAIDRLAQRHPLQKLKSPSRDVSAFIHILGLASFTYSYYFLSANPNQINQSYGWHFQYLTIIGLTLATLTFSFGLLSDLTLSPRLFNLKNILSVTSLPLEFLISVLYWGLRAIDPTLVVPPELELPLTPDLSFHLVPTVMLLVDLLFLSPPWTITTIPALVTSAGIAFTYWFWIELCYTRNGFYPYPLFEILGTGERVGLFGGSAVVMTASTFILKWLYGRVNGVDVGMGRSRPGSGKKTM